MSMLAPRQSGVGPAPAPASAGVPWLACSPRSGSGTQAPSIRGSAFPHSCHRHVFHVIGSGEAGSGEGTSASKLVGQKATYYLLSFHRLVTWLLSNVPGPGSGFPVKALLHGGAGTSGESAVSSVA